MTLNQWKEKCNSREIVNWFVEKDHYRVGLDNGGTAIQIMNGLGFKNPESNQSTEILAKIHFRNSLNMARTYFNRDGFILKGKKFGKGTPTLYFLIDNYSEERVERHYSLKNRAEKSFSRLRDDKLTLLQLMEKVKDKKTLESFRKAYSSKANINLPQEKVKQLKNDSK